MAIDHDVVEKARRSELSYPCPRYQGRTKSPYKAQPQKYPAHPLGQGPPTRGPKTITPPSQNCRSSACPHLKSHALFVVGRVGHDAIRRNLVREAPDLLVGCQGAGKTGSKNNGSTRGGESCVFSGGGRARRVPRSPRCYRTVTLPCQTTHRTTNGGSALLRENKNASPAKKNSPGSASTVSRSMMHGPASIFEHGSPAAVIDPGQQLSAAAAEAAESNRARRAGSFGGKVRVGVKWHTSER